MTICVIGHFCIDVIEYPDKSETRSYGGIYFAVAALANLMGSKDKIVPVFGVGKDDYDGFIERLKLYPNVDTSGIFKFDGPTNQVHLIYSTKEKRVECSRHISEPVVWKKIKPYLDADMILVNMISGFDITLETLDEIRMESRENKTPIYLDVHCLPCGIGADLTRFYTPLETWRRWLFMLHAVQMNQNEAAHISLERFDELSLAKHVLALDTKALHITKGEHGSTLFIDEHKNIKRFEVAGINSEKAIETTGCGDLFGAAYCAYYLKSKDIIASTHFANRVASFNAQFSGSTGIDLMSRFSVYSFQEMEDDR